MGTQDTREMPRFTAEQWSVVMNLLSLQRDMLEAQAAERLGNETSSPFGAFTSDEAVEALRLVETTRREFDSAIERARPAK